MTRTKAYPHILGVSGDEGESPGVLAVHSVLDPSPDYPDEGRIIVGSPATSPKRPGCLPQLAAFSASIEGAEAICETLQQAISDVRAAAGQRRSGVLDAPSYLLGYVRIGRMSLTGNRSLWLKENTESIEVRAGRENGKDLYVRIDATNPQFNEFRDLFGAARFAAEWEDGNGTALSPMGIERHGYEDAEDTVTDWTGRGTTVILFTVADPTRWPEPQPFRVIVRHGLHFAVQRRQRRLFEPDLIGHTTYYWEPDYWEPATERVCGVSPDCLMSMVMQRLVTSTIFREGMAVVTTAGKVSTVDLGELKPPARPT
jgi:hypothetical protein